MTPTKGRRSRRRSLEIDRARGKPHEGLEIQVPEFGFYLIEALYEVGPMGSSALGSQVLSWQELVAWSQATGTTMTRWDFLTIRRLSAEYVKWVEKAKDPACPPPFVQDETTHREKVVEDLNRYFERAEKENSRENASDERSSYPGSTG